MRDFESYIKNKKVKIRQVDINLAKSLRIDIIERSQKALKLDAKEFSKFMFENLYDSLREICDAILSINGFKSYSHEASIAYLKKFEISEKIIIELDRFRDKRNSSKYYGKSISEDDAKEIMDFYINYSKNLIKILDEEIKRVK